MAKFQRLARLIELVTVIKYHPSWGPKRLAEYFEISEKRIYDDINTLNAANIPIVFNGVGYSFLNRPYLPPVQFTMEEAMALLVSGTVLESQRGDAHAMAARSAGNKLLELLPDVTRSALLELAGRVRVDTKGRPRAGAALNRLQRALVEKRTVRFSYESFSSGEKTRRDANPYAVVFRGNAWYMIGHCHLRGNVRTFRVNRMSAIRNTDATFTYPDSFSLEDHLDKSWSIFQGEEVEVQVRFDRHVAPFITEHLWQPDQEITKHADGGITFTTTVKGTLEIRRWILSWGDHAQVLAPQSLREELQAITHAMAVLYTQKFMGNVKRYKVAEKQTKYQAKPKPGE